MYGVWKVELPDRAGTRIEFHRGPDDAVKDGVLDVTNNNHRVVIHASRTIRMEFMPDEEA